MTTVNFIVSMSDFDRGVQTTESSPTVNILLIKAGSFKGSPTIDNIYKWHNKYIYISINIYSNTLYIGI